MEKYLFVIVGRSYDLGRRSASRRKQDPVLLKKTIEGVGFKVIVNSKSDTDLVELFSNINTAETKLCSDVKIRLHGLSNKQLIFSFKSVSGMAAIKVFDENLINIIKNDFETRWKEL